MTRAVFLLRLWAVLFLAGIGTSSCGLIGLQHARIYEQPDGTVVERVTGFPAPETLPKGGNISEEGLRVSLRRIIVRYHGSISFSKFDPQPLLTNDQVQAFSAVLAKELPGLKPDQRIRIAFRDARKRNLNEMDVYRDGAYVIYYFNALVANPKLALEAGGPPVPEATMDELPGQKLTLRYPYTAILRDPAQGSQEAAAADVAGAKALIEKSRDDKAISDAEATRLLGVVDATPAVRVEDWRVYWEKRATLKKAREQGLMDEAGYQAQLAKIERELLAR